MNQRHRTVLAVASLIAASTLAAVSGCGITPESTSEPIQPPPGIAVTTPSQAPDASPSGRTPEYLYLVEDDNIARVTRHVTVTPTIDSVLKDLFAGPDDGETAAGYTSALFGPSVVSSVKTNGGQAVVALAAPVADDARNDIILAYAQLVCTLTALPQITGVTFTNNGQPTSVPRGDGSLSGRPLTAIDYADLLAP